MIAIKFESGKYMWNKKMRQIMPVLKQCLGKFDINSRLVLSVLTWCKKEAYSADVVETRETVNVSTVAFTHYSS